ncbi:MAG: hypothetical protein HY782_12625 [Chloroflexi bacterium]|nr:hypothetical protein [Chloroflexota bacterium]
MLSRLLGSRPAPPPPAPTPPPPPVPPPPDDTPALMQPRVLMIVYNPVVDAAGNKLIQTLGWRDPDQLAAGYIADVKECSAGFVDYQIVERIEADELPVKKDGFQYAPSDFVGFYRAGSGFHDPDAVDYEAIVAKFNLLQRIANNEIDEVWLFGGPYFGFYESTMAGAGAFWCNAPPVPNTANCPRRFVIMGFNYERGVGEMLEDLGHRTESVLAHLFRSDAAIGRAYNSSAAPIVQSANLFERFITYDRTAPGRANVGVLHFAPNSVADYDWGNATRVQSCADDWLLFPNLPDPPNLRAVDCGDWGNGDIREHHKWWFKRLPKAPGVTDGVSNNWWQFTIDVNRA